MSQQCMDWISDDSKYALMYDRFEGGRGDSLHAYISHLDVLGTLHWVRVESMDGLDCDLRSLIEALLGDVGVP